MTPTDNFDDLLNHYECRASDIVQQHDDDIRALFAQSGLLNEAPPERVDFDTLRAEVEQVEREWRIEPAGARPLTSRQRSGWQQALDECDDLLVTAFSEGKRRLLTRDSVPLKRFAATDRWLTAVGQGLQLRSDEIAALRDRVQGAATSTLALHIPSIGTLVNEAVATQIAQGMTNPRQQYNAVLSELTRERWGQRFLMDDTIMGQDLLKAGAWRRLLCQEWQIEALPQEDSSHAVLAISSLTRAGWPRWVSNYALTCARRNDVEPGSIPFGSETLAEFVEAAWKAMSDTLDVILDEPTQIIMAWFNFVVKTLLIARGVRPSVGLLAVRVARRLKPGLNALSARASTEPLGDRLAESLFKQLEATVGSDKVPYALQMICGVSYDAARSSLKQINQRIAADSNLDIDLRLKQLGELKGLRYGSVSDVARAASTELKWKVPPDLFEIQ